jgi:hypothetical protein
MQGGSAAVPDPPADPFARTGTARRLRARLEPHEGEHPIAWTRAWTSRDGRWNWLLAARHRDFVLLTDQRLLLFACGFFTRRPRRCVLDRTLRSVAVDDVGRTPERSLRVSTWSGRPLRLDFGRRPADRELAAALLRHQHRNTNEHHGEKPCPS